MNVLVYNRKTTNTNVKSEYPSRDLCLINFDEYKIKLNNLSCAEIFLHFFEFIIYYFKSDSVNAL